MSRIAVIGGGISGLGAAWLLARQHDVLLFEREPRLGGHTHTHVIAAADGPLALDTGFIVHNDRTYPLLVRLLNELGVERLESDMSFGVSDPVTGFEFSTRDLNGLFADRRNLVRAPHYRFLGEILRFNRTARRALTSAPELNGSLAEFCDRHGFVGSVVDRYIQPLACAIWSASAETIGTFPFATLARFFDHHGMLRTLDHPTWKVIRGGSSTYIPKLTASPRITVHLSAAPRSVARTHSGVKLTFADRSPLEVEQVVFACHGDEVLPLLTDASAQEREVLGAFRTTPNLAVLHTDPGFLPRRVAAQAAWNYLLGSPTGGATITYDLNRLQALSQRTRYCVTLNPRRPIDPSKVLAQMHYTHPLYTRDGVAAQARWAEVSGANRIHYAGAYWFYGFHEDGLRSAVRVADRLGVKW